MEEARVTEPVSPMGTTAAASVGVCVRVVSVAQSCPTLCNPTDYSPPGSSWDLRMENRPWGFLGKNTGTGCHLPLQNIQVGFPRYVDKWRF